MRTERRRRRAFSRSAMSNEPLANAGVRFPPPFVYLIGLGIGYGLNKWVPLRLASPEPRWMFDLGLGLVVLGVAFALWGIVTFKRHRTAIIPNRPATLVVTAGPYGITRNPMYVGMTCFYIGGSFLLDTWWAFVLLPVVVGIIDRQVIAREERYLSSAFGAEYAGYRANVRRWL
jgi:protein-S-isoprenylcysteine O-methyltransferase Ste14